MTFFTAIKDSRLERKWVSESHLKNLYPRWRNLDFEFLCWLSAGFEAACLAYTIYYIGAFARQGEWAGGSESSSAWRSRDKISRFAATQLIIISRCAMNSAALVCRNSRHSTRHIIKTYESLLWSTSWLQQLSPPRCLLGVGRTTAKSADGYGETVEIYFDVRVWRPRP